MDYIIKLDSLGEQITFARIGRHFGYSTQAAKSFCQTLDLKGYIELRPFEVAKKGFIGRYEFILKEKSRAFEFMNRVTSENGK
jgi:hypothetical protein